MLTIHSSEVLAHAFMVPLLLGLQLCSTLQQAPGQLLISWSLRNIEKKIFVFHNHLLCAHSKETETYKVPPPKGSTFPLQYHILGPKPLEDTNLNYRFCLLVLIKFYTSQCKALPLLFTQSCKLLPLFLIYFSVFVSSLSLSVSLTHSHYQSMLSIGTEPTRF